MNGRPSERPYPNEAYHPSGKLWWEMPTGSGKNSVGGEHQLGAWLYYNKSIGELFTMLELRQALGDGGDGDDANSDEQLGRRLRELRKLGWVMPSNIGHPTIPARHYRLDQKGWHIGAGVNQPTKQTDPYQHVVDAAARLNPFQRQKLIDVLLEMSQNDDPALF